MSKKLYVGNLPYTATEEEVTEFFSPHAEVVSVSLITDRETGKPRGFGFVEVSADDVESIIEQLNGAEMGGRSLKINEAVQKKRSFGGGGGRRRDE